MSRFAQGVKRFRSQLFLQAMAIPAIVWLVVFAYIPMAGVTMAFRDYRIGGSLFSGDWVGLKHFIAFWNDPFAIQSLWNTLIISGLKLLFVFPMPIIFALLLNEVRAVRYKKYVQTLSYLPFFISWVVLVSMMHTILGMEGPINNLLISTGLTARKISFLGKPEYFRTIAVLSDLWKNLGWNSIIYIAAIASIPQDMYESALIDGASRFQRAMRITLPSIMPTVVIMLILQVSRILEANFDQHFLMGNPMVVDVSETIDVYVYRMGMRLSRYSFAAAVGLFRSVVAFVLLFVANRVARMISKGEQGLF